MIAFFRALTTQRRIISALVIREIYTRYGRESLSFAWIFLEPLLFVFPVLTMWSVIRPRYTEGGLLWADVSWSGYLPLMLYRHLGGMAIHAIRGNASLLYHRAITTFDILAARIVLEVFSNLGAAVVSLVVLVAVGAVQPPQNVTMLYVGYLYMIWWCASVALVIGALSERSVWVEKIWMPIGYMYIAVSGCFYLSYWLPPVARRIALFQPSLQAYEMIRAGMFGSTVPTYFDFGYTTFVLALLTIMGLSWLITVRKWLVFE
ncbi:MAG: ABC transporter permease [Alphaproteobacteria bacterium]|nr:ABC transporter permease [Alphaproteobacteria bacterium]MBV9862096.1 ABC transporter permease [Alphaproteobacteria bacterium]